MAKSFKSRSAPHLHGVVSWVGWHIGELMVVTATLVAAVVVSVWFLLAAGVFTAAWCAHEVRLWHRNRRIVAAGSHLDDDAGDAWASA